MTLPRKDCTAESPMPMKDKDAYYWIHADAKDVAEFFNLIIYVCPHCRLAFTALPRDRPAE